MTGAHTAHDGVVGDELDRMDSPEAAGDELDPRSLEAIDDLFGVGVGVAVGLVEHQIEMGCEESADPDEHGDHWHGDGTDTWDPAGQLVDRDPDAEGEEGKGDDAVSPVAASR